MPLVALHLTYCEIRISFSTNAGLPPSVQVMTQGIGTYQTKAVLPEDVFKFNSYWQMCYFLNHKDNSLLMNII